MRKVNLILSILLSVVIVAYLIIAPPYIIKALNRDIYREWLEHDTEPYTGIITMWHIVGFKTYQGSMSLWLDQWIKKIENRHHGVYIKLKAMSVDEAQERLIRGETADIYSFPLGWTYSERLSPIVLKEMPNYAGNINTIGYEGEALYAAAYAVSGYLLIINQAIAQEGGLGEVPDPIDTAWLNQAAAKLTFERGRKKKLTAGLTGNPVIATYMSAETLAGDYEQFIAGNGGLAIADARAAGDLKRSLEYSSGFTFGAYPLTNFTDQVQLVGIDKNILNVKYNYAIELIDILLSLESQQSLTELGACPAVKIEKPKHLNSTTQLLYSQLKEPLVPNTFLYQRYKIVLAEAALRALKKDKNGKLDFEQRIKELVQLP